MNNLQLVWLLARLIDGQCVLTFTGKPHEVRRVLPLVRLTLLRSRESKGPAIAGDIDIALILAEITWEINDSDCVVVTRQLTECTFDGVSLNRSGDEGERCECSEEFHDVAWQ